MESEADIAIIGAGAAGLAAAIFAAERAATGRRVILLERAARVGAKILISGGGRCNVTNASVTPDDFNGARNIVRNVLAAFDVAAARRWFADLGVALKQEETGKLFPVSDSARTVLEALLRRCADLGVDIRTGNHVTKIERTTHGFDVTCADRVLRAGRLIMATGGRSLPKTGSDGSAWALVQQLGHQVTPTYPALVPLLLTESSFHNSLSGISQTVELSIFIDEKLQDRRAGSLLWTHFGISGPVVMDASRHWVVGHAEGHRVSLRCNFMAGESFETVDAWIAGRGVTTPRMSLARLISTRLPDRMALALLGHLSLDATLPVGQLQRAARRQVVHALTAFELPVSGPRGWNFAEVTAGGVPLQEIDYRTMASRRVDDLYLIGEMLDCDGRIGGFNFQWAWATGYLAGRAAAAECQR